MSPNYPGDNPSITPNEINRVGCLARAEATPFPALVTSQNLFQFGIGPNLTVILVSPPSLPPLVIDANSSLIELDENVVTSSRKCRQSDLLL
ncbi:unnamed protein product [Ilex paraguariensis]|uniref:Uncharacterized protein n=1 Tax=Ilex paraguariensis TaxID=185542 RepID=A0ABC8SL29_9AQUA